ncbi:MAG: preprotein translocase subunit YajC [Corynebacterium sp.]|nr:preprotein translocase subunit YajC [Corynebacterium sp.]
MELLFILLLLLLLFVPQYMLQRKQRAHLERLRALRDSLNVGDVVVTGAGLRGTVANISETAIDLEIASGVITTWEKESVIRNVSAEQAADDAEDFEYLDDAAPADELPADSAEIDYAAVNKTETLGEDRPEQR